MSDQRLSILDNLHNTLSTILLSLAHGLHPTSPRHHRSFNEDYFSVGKLFQRQLFTVIIFRLTGTLFQALVWFFKISSFFFSVSWASRINPPHFHIFFLWGRKSTQTNKTKTISLEWYWTTGGTVCEISFDFLKKLLKCNICLCYRCCFLLCLNDLYVLYITDHGIKAVILKSAVFPVCMKA